MLEVEELHAFYDKSHILHGVTLKVAAGEIVALLGRNGSGRSTTINALMGLVRHHGSICLDGKDITGLPVHKIAHLGLGLVPEGRDIFPDLTVKENLILGIKHQDTSENPWTIDDIYEVFPRLKERADTSAGVLSGGEQQMLTICRTLMGNPRLIMIDEPTEGLSPIMIEEVRKLLVRISERGIAILLVEQKLTIALAIASRLYVMGHGEIVFEGTPQQLRDNAQLRQEWLEV